MEKQNKVEIPQGDRHAKFLEYLPQTNYNMTKAALKAGFAPSTAHKCQKRIFAVAMRKHTETLANMAQNYASKKEIVKHELIRDKIGYSRDKVMNRYKFIIEQERDMGAKLKALDPLLREEGIFLKDEREATIVPQLNITVSEIQKPPTHKEVVVID